MTCGISSRSAGCSLILPSRAHRAAAAHRVGIERAGGGRILVGWTQGARLTNSVTGDRAILSDKLRAIAGPAGRAYSVRAGCAGSRFVCDPVNARSATLTGSVQGGRALLTSEFARHAIRAICALSIGEESARRCDELAGSTWRTLHTNAI